MSQEENNVSEEENPDHLNQPQETSEPEPDRKAGDIQGSEVEITEKDTNVEAEKIEQDLKSMAKQFEEKEDESRSTIKKLLISFGFLLGPILLIIMILIDSDPLFGTILLGLSGLITTILVLSVLQVSWMKSKSID